ncbi:hypothetical protein BH09PAT2_BH09PAT2_03380 [soil metagenome]
MQSAVKVWRRQKKDKLLLGQHGVVESWTTIFVAPPKFHHETPYTVVLVRLESGDLVYGQLVNFEDTDKRIGLPVKSILRKNGAVDPEELIEYGVKFIPVP